MKKFTVLAVMLMLIVVASPSIANDWLLVPGIRVGDVRRDASESELRKLFGAENVQPSKIDIGEGEIEDGLVLFPMNQRRRLEILLTPNRLVEFVRVQGDRSSWKFRNGITIGTTLKELEVLNDGPFTLSGWGWDYSGAILGWKGGRLASSLPISETVWMRLSPSPNSRWQVLTKAEHESLVGDKDHDSSEPALQKLNPALTFIQVWLAQQ